MYRAGVEVLLWGGCFVLSWCGSPVVGRLLCTVLVWRFCCGEDAMHYTGVEVLLWEDTMYCPVVEVLMWGGCYVMSWGGGAVVGGHYVLSWCGGAVVGRLLCTVLVWSCFCGKFAMYCPIAEVLLWGGCYVMSSCGGSVVGRLLCTVLVWRITCAEAARYCVVVEVMFLVDCYVQSLVGFQLWEGCYVMCCCGSAVVGRLLCTVLV